MRLGVVILPEHRWPDAQRLWTRAEALGFDHAWTYDHLAWRSLRDSPWFAAMPTLTAAAMTTTTIRLGPLVSSPNFREPVAFAKELMTLDDISNGRLTVGIGAGGEGWDASMLGTAPWSKAERADRFAEFVELTDLLLRQPATSFSGTHYSADGGRSIPGSTQRPRPPFAIAATGRRGLELAARHGQTWVTTGDRRGDGSVPPADGAAIVRRQIERLEEACDEQGRALDSIGRMVLTGAELDPALGSVESFRDAVGTYDAAGVTDLVVHWPRSTAPYQGDVSRFEEVLAAIW